MKIINLLLLLIFAISQSVQAQLFEVEGDGKINNTLEFCDSNSTSVLKVGSIFATYPDNAGSNASPSLTIKTETNPIVPNTFADIILESSDQIHLNTNTETRLYVGPSGRVGIGTNLPAKDLHVMDDIVVGGGPDNFASASEYVRLHAQSESWYVGALNEDTEAASDFIIGKSSGASDYFHLENGGDIGIGTSNPGAKLEVVDAFNPIRTTTTGANNYTTYLTQNGHIGYSGVQHGDFDMDFGTSAHNDNGKVHLVIRNSPGLTIDEERKAGIGTEDPLAKLHVEDDEHQLVLRNRDQQSNTWYMGASKDTWGVGGQKLVIDDDSQSGLPILCLHSTEESVGVATAYAHANYKFAVKGTMIAEDYHTAPFANWPDYVFADDYRLRSIEEVKQSIDEQGHLPNIPSAEEIAKNGFLLGEMNRKMMEKIEELTLYVIQLNENNKSLQTQLDAVQSTLRK